MKNYLDDPRREQILHQAHIADSLPDIEAAITALNGWRQAHPEDIGIADAYEPLELIRMTLRETATQEAA